MSVATNEVTEHAFYLDAWLYGRHAFGDGWFTITRQDWQTWVCQGRTR